MILKKVIYMIVVTPHKIKAFIKTTKVLTSCISYNTS